MCHMRCLICIGADRIRFASSFIYKVLEDSGLPWVYGGEYDAFYDLVVKVVKAWISVGLRPIFVFDGQ